MKKSESQKNKANISILYDVLGKILSTKHQANINFVVKKGGQA